MARALSGILVTVILILLAACSTSKTLNEPTSTVVERSAVVDKAQSWWTYRFRIGWPEEEKPEFAIDLLLAHALIKPVLESNSGNIPWWRFHRRAARDHAGHQFSFIFYTDDATGAAVVNSLDNSLLLTELKEGGLIIKTVSSSSEKDSNSDVEAHSDKSWTPVIQKTWPTYIMGISNFWLALIDEVKSEQSNKQLAAPDNSNTVNELLNTYREVDKEIAELWKSEGQHALLHHLSAVFGYKPILLKKEVTF